MGVVPREESSAKLSDASWALRSFVNLEAQGRVSGELGGKFVSLPLGVLSSGGPCWRQVVAGQ
jgi:hypothetical protein